MLAENERWQATLDALRAIRDDPTETPWRREKAAGALLSAGRRLYGGPAPSTGRHTCGAGAFMYTRAQEEGWGSGT